MLRERITPFFLGRYHCVELIGRGPSGEVFRGRTYGIGGFEKSYALKRLSSGLGRYPQLVDQLIEQVKRLSQLDHANLVRIHEINVHEGRYYLATDLVDGVDLEAVLGALAGLRMAMPAPLAVHLVAEVATALEHAVRLSGAEASRGLAHADLAPSRIMVSQHGEVRVLDLGLPSSLGVLDGGGTASRRPTARIAYSSPEQLRGSPGDSRSDQFTLGVLLFELVTGTRLFARSNVELTREALLEATVPPLVHPAGRADPELEGLVRRVLSVDPDRRFPTMAALLAALRKYLTARSPTPDGARLASLLQSELGLLAPPADLSDPGLTIEGVKRARPGREAPDEPTSGPPPATDAREWGENSGAWEELDSDGEEVSSGGSGWGNERPRTQQLKMPPVAGMPALSIQEALRPAGEPASRAAGPPSLDPDEEHSVPSLATETQHFEWDAIELIKRRKAERARALDVLRSIDDAFPAGAPPEELALFGGGADESVVTAMAGGRRLAPRAGDLLQGPADSGATRPVQVPDLRPLREARSGGSQRLEARADLRSEARAEARADAAGAEVLDEPGQDPQRVTAALPALPRLAPVILDPVEPESDLLAPLQRAGASTAPPPSLQADDSDPPLESGSYPAITFTEIDVGRPGPTPTDEVAGRRLRVPASAPDRATPSVEIDSSHSHPTTPLVRAVQDALWVEAARAAAAEGARGRAPVGGVSKIDLPPLPDPNRRRTSAPPRRRRRSRRLWLTGLAVVMVAGAAGVLVPLLLPGLIRGLGQGRGRPTARPLPAASAPVAPTASAARPGALTPTPPAPLPAAAPSGPATPPPLVAAPPVAPAPAAVSPSAEGSPATPPAAAGSPAVPGAETPAAASPTAAAAAAAHPPEAPAGPGTLALRSEPAGASVYVDGAARGTTPAKLSLPPSQAVKLVVLLAGHQIWARELSADERPAELEATLVVPPAPPEGGARGKLRVHCPPGERWLFVDGIDLGRRCKKPQTVVLTAGRHTIAARDPLTGKKTQQRVRVHRRKSLKLVLR